MSTRTAAWLAWSLCTLSLALTAVSLLLLALNLSHPNTHIYDFWLENSVVPLSFAIIGAIIASRLPAIPLGWLYCAAAFSSAVAHLSAEYAIYALIAQPNSLPAGQALAWLESWVWILAPGCVVLSLLLYLSPNAPHKPAYSAKRHANLFTDTPLPRPSSFNEDNVSDKPAWVQNKPLLSPTKIQELTTLYRQRLRALKSVDDMVGRVVGTLRDIGELSNTYIVLTSDNGYYLGEHRLEEKAAAYNAGPRIPLVIRGPGHVPAGVSRSQMALNNDFAPTFASWAGVQPPPFVDGRSLGPLLTTSPPPWRSAFLIEHRKAPEEFAYVKAIPNYDAIRTARYSYVEYATGERELYDLSADPTELTNIYASASPTLISNLQARLAALKSCKGWDASVSTSCKKAEGGS